MRLYVIGPVTGMPGKNRAAFEDARDKLAAMGHRADTPHVLVPDGATWEQAMRISLNRLTQPRRGGAPLYDGVARLPGWRESKGAALEDEVARACGIRTMDLADWLDPSAPAAAGAAQDAAMPCFDVGEVRVKVEVDAESVAKSLCEAMKPALQMVVR